MRNVRLYLGDCMELMKNIPDKVIDLILCDLPYGVSACKWDSILPMDKLWLEYKRILKEDGVIALFGREPFSSLLRSSNMDMYKYDWYWIKPHGANFLNIKYRPFEVVETISIFTNNPVSYSKKNKNNRYFPQFEEGKPYISKSGKQVNDRNNSSVRSPIEQTVTVNSGTRYPKNILYFNKDKEKLHPTQKPVALLEYLIKTYTKEKEVVLDSCMGVGSTGLACLSLDRLFIGMEIDENYFNITKKRLNEEVDDENI